jgi:hypothetical protein
MKALPRIRLGLILILLVTGITAISWCCILPCMLGLSRSISDRQSSAVIQARAEVASNELVRALSAQWYRVRAVAKFAATDQNLSELRIRLSAIGNANKVYRPRFLRHRIEAYAA